MLDVGILFSLVSRGTVKLDEMKISPGNKIFQHSVAGITLLAFLLTQLVWPLPVSAQDTLRQQPPSQTKSGLEELTNELQREKTTSQSVTTPTATTAGVEERYSRRVFARKVAVGSMWGLAAGILGVSIVATWKNPWKREALSQVLPKVDVERYRRYRDLIRKIADKPYAIPGVDVRGRYAEVTHLVLRGSDDVILAEIERILIASKNIDHKKAAVAALFSISKDPLDFLRRISTEHRAGYNDPNFEVRDFTFGALMASDAQRYGEEVFDLGLSDPLESRRRPVLELLKKEEHKTFDDLLARKGLDHKFQEVRAYALETLKKSDRFIWDESFRAKLRSLLEDPSPTIRSQAVFLLASVNAPRAPPSDVKDPLIRVFNDDSDEQVRLSAAYGVYRYGVEQSEAAVELLVEKGLSHPFPEIKATAAKFLALRSSSEASARETINKESRSSSAEVRQGVVMGLRYLQDLKPLIPFLKDPDESVRREAALEFARRGSDEANIDFVLAEGVGLHDPSPRVAVAVAKVLADGLRSKLNRTKDTGDYGKIFRRLFRFFRYPDIRLSLISAVSSPEGWRFFIELVNQVSKDIAQNNRLLDPGDFNVLLFALSLPGELPLKTRITYTKQLAEIVSNSKSEYFQRFGAWSLYHAIMTIGNEDGFSEALQASAPDLIANLRSIVHRDSFDYESIFNQKANPQGKFTAKLYAMLEPIDQIDFLIHHWGFRVVGRDGYVYTLEKTISGREVRIIVDPRGNAADHIQKDADDPGIHMLVYNGHSGVSLFEKKFDITELPDIHIHQGPKIVAAFGCSTCSWHFRDLIQRQPLNHLIGTNTFSTSLAGIVSLGAILQGIVSGKDLKTISAQTARELEKAQKQYGLKMESGQGAFEVELLFPHQEETIMRTMLQWRRASKDLFYFPYIQDLLIEIHGSASSGLEEQGGRVEDRRRFLKTLAAGAVGLAAGVPVISQGREQEPPARLSQERQAIRSHMQESLEALGRQGPEGVAPIIIGPLLQEVDSRSRFLAGLEEQGIYLDDGKDKVSLFTRIITQHPEARLLRFAGLEEETRELLPLASLAGMTLQAAWPTHGLLSVISQITGLEEFFLQTQADFQGFQADLKALSSGA